MNFSVVLDCSWFFDEGYREGYLPSSMCWRLDDVRIHLRECYLFINNGLAFYGISEGIV